MLDVIVLVAMAVTAVAVAAGLIVQAGFPAIPSAIAAAALYLIMAASYLMVARASRTGSDSFRLDEIEGALENIDSDLKRIDRAEGGQGRIEELAGELESMHARIEGLRSDLEVETNSQREKIANDLGKLEGLIKQLSQDLTGGVPTEPSTPELVEVERALALASEDLSHPDDLARSEDLTPSDDLTFSGEEIETVVTAVTEIVQTEESGEGGEIVETETVLAITEISESVPPTDVFAEGEEEEAAEPIEEGSADVDEILGTLHRAIEAGRVDLYVQPIVTLPKRKTRYYQALTRIRDDADEAIPPGDYLLVAENAGLMPLIDNVLIVKSVQV
ncbi:MAG: EAL domain-containing protein, partial [Methyloceanibacter sp.]